MGRIFRVPRRYRRNITLTAKDHVVELSYAITDGNGWIRMGGKTRDPNGNGWIKIDGKTKDHKGSKMPLESNWNAGLAILPSYLEKGFELKNAGKAKVEGKDAFGVRISNKDRTFDGTFYFDVKTGLLVKNNRPVQHITTGQMMDGDLFLSDYKEVSGIPYPHHIGSYAGGKKMFEMQITSVEFLEKLDDRLFDRP